MTVKSNVKQVEEGLTEEAGSGAISLDANNKIDERPGTDEATAAITMTEEKRKGRRKGRLEKEEERMEKKKSGYHLIVDTCSLLHGMDSQSIDQLRSIYSCTIVVPIVVIHEVDQLRQAGGLVSGSGLLIIRVRLNTISPSLLRKSEDPDTALSARHAMRYIEPCRCIGQDILFIHEINLQHPIHEINLQHHNDDPIKCQS